MTILFTRNLIAYTCLTLLLAACRQTDHLLPDCQEDLSLTCIKSGWESETRMLTDNDGNGSFTEGDRIHLFITSENTSSALEMEYEKGEWTPALKRSDYGKGKLELTALFPLLPSAGGNGNIRQISLPQNQELPENHAAADILFGSTQINADASSAALQFHHAMHRLCIQLKGTVPADLQLEIRTRTAGTISTADGSVTTSSDGTFSWIRPQKQGSSMYTAIILPQEATPYNSGEGLIRLTSGGKTAIYTLNADITAFNPGMQTTLNLTVKPNEEAGETDLDFCNQTFWVYGITAPVFPGKENVSTLSVNTWVTNFPEGEWFRYDYQAIGLPNEENYLTWKEGCGWFDCNKSFEYKGDRNMCWAATASNLIHWWLSNNRKYVEAYEAEYTDYPCPTGYRKMTENDQQHSEVFNFFKKSYPDMGSWDTGGVNWFINGDKRNLIYSSNEDFPGFFHHVFTQDIPVATETRNTSKENFNLWIKNAFRKHNAIGFSANGFVGPNASRHSMTIWGAEFDEEGNVAFLYFCDNNYGEVEPNHASLRRFKVVYSSSTSQGTYLTALDYNDGTQPKAKALICSITLVDLRQDIWKSKYPDL